MKTFFAVFAPLTAGFCRLTAWASYQLAVFDLRAREAHLQGLCDILRDTADVRLRADIAQRIRSLCGELVEARNAVRAMRPHAKRNSGWRAA